MTNISANQQSYRYERHLEIRGFGPTGQKKLKDSSALVIGAGGLGAVVCEQLVRNGVGHITIIDPDEVELWNLHRQVMFEEQDIGTPKVEAAKKYASKINAEVNLNPIVAKFDNSNNDTLTQSADIVIDCTDNLNTRYLANETALKHKKDLISGAVYNLEGSIFVSKGHDPSYPCYRCAFHKNPGERELKVCASGPILGPVVSIIGSMMAMETIKELTNLGFSSAGKLILYDGRLLKFREISIQKKNHCLTCQ